MDNNRVTVRVRVMGKDMVDNIMEDTVDNTKAVVVHSVTFMSGKWFVTVYVYDFGSTAHFIV